MRRVEWTTGNRAGVTDSAGAERMPGPQPASGGALGWKFLTLTTRAPAVASRRFNPRYAREQLLHVRKAFGKFWRSSPWGKAVRLKLSQPERVTKWGEWKPASSRATTRARRDTAFVMGLETAPGGMVHLHLAVYGEFVHWTLLKALWARALGYTAKVDPYSKTQRLPGDVKVKRLKGDTPAQLQASLREVLKYSTKGEGRSAADRVQRAALLEYAYRGIRRVEFGGFLRQLPELTRQELTTSTQKECSTADCAPAPGESRWIWRGMHSVALTAANGGFGPLKVDPVTVVHGRYYCPDYDPPPWWDAAHDVDHTDVLTDDIAPDWDAILDHIERERHERAKSA